MVIGIVDGDSQTVESLSELIADAYPNGIVAYCGGSGGELMEIVKDNRFDVVITGMNLDDSSGIELCKQLQKETRNTEVIVLGTGQELAKAEKISEYGVERMVVKPVTGEKINEVIGHIRETEANKKGETELRRRVGSVEFTNHIFAMLKEGEKAKIRNIVFPTEISYKKGGAIKSYEIFLINILCFFLKENGYDDIFDEDIFSEMLNLVTDEQRMNYVMEKYSCVIDTIRKREEYSLDDGRITKIKRYIEDHYGNPGLSCDFLAERSGVSARHLRRLFVKTYGMGIQEYIMNVRIEKAKKMLTDTVLPIETIILKVGYNSPRYFRKLFKAQIGCTMSEYRSGKTEDVSEE